jgi:hypothetical protein
LPPGSAAAAEQLCDSHDGVLLGHMRGAIAVTPLATAISAPKVFDAPLYELARTLAE